MKKTWKKNMAALILITAVSTAFTACEGKKEKVTVSNDAPQESKSEYVYQASFQDIEIPLETITRTCAYDGHIYIAGYQYEENKKGKSVCKNYLISCDSEGNVELCKDLRQEMDEEEALSIDSLPVSQYINKGILTDLYPFMEHDDEVHKEDFIDSVINTLDHDGKIYYMGSTFSVRPLLGSRDLVGDIESWTVDDMIKLYDELPDGGVFLCNETYNMSRQLFLQNIISNQLENFVDMDTGEAALDSEEFIKILEFSRNFPDEKDIAQDITSRFEIGMPIMVQTGKLMFSDCFNLSCLPDIGMYTRIYKKAGGFTVLNYPSIEGDDRLSMTLDHNTVAITEQCSDKEGAWEFVRMFLTYEYQKNNGFYNGIPTRQDALDKLLEYTMVTEAFTDEDGMQVEPIDIHYLHDDYDVYVGPLSEKEISIVRSIIGRVGKCTYYDSVVQDINKMIAEEAETFYSGDKTAMEAAGVIQNRVKIYVSEIS